MDILFEWIAKDPSTRLPVAVAIIGATGAIIASAFTILFWPALKLLLQKCVAFVSNTLLRANLERKYLDWVINNFRYIPVLPTTLVPVTQKHTHELDELYVALKVSDKADDSSFDLSVPAVIRDNRCLVIIGHPGAGKTTILRFLALTFARARRKYPQVTRNEPFSEEAVKFRQAREFVTGDAGFTTPPLHIFVYLNRLRPHLEGASGTNLLDVVRSEVRSVEALQGFPPGFFTKKFDAGQCIFFLDGFDEIGTPMGRDAAAQQIGKLVTASPNGNRFVVSSRIVGYNGQLNEYGFRVFKVQELSNNMIVALVRRWYVALGEEDLAEQLIATLESNPRIRQLAINPMLLSLIVLVQYVRRLIPDRRHVLYDECVKILVERRYAPPPVQEEYNKTLAGDDAVAILREIAQMMHIRKVREVSRRELETKLVPEAMAAMGLGRASAASPEAFSRTSRREAS
jgi:energy-coupling factor transporter ATP-binding protein EcfA2